ncbi:FadR/GntR family transcriptional regulator [Glycomyces algeriensis]|jgi:DNA-binding FadR family transcriptional regulator|nr:FadR/GntR family transcriptional regulator [Glycomyces algeriensis]MDA1364439.1 FadR/GntR family transcriptional regulator [Glycomyces algeriensis]MDR7350472.1 GntR family transcriptional repressor for pyruvate dehydrogenase complex [Glycomyces algeriensis]
MSRTDDVVNGIKHMILNGDLQPGERLPVEKELAETLGVSRGSLREGVRALSILGILNSRQGDGTYVTDLDVSQLLAPMGFVVDLQGDGQTLHLHAIRRLLECEAARLAATRITDEALKEAEALLEEAGRILDENPEAHERIIEIDIAFHRIIAAHTGNPVLTGMIETFASRTVRERLWRSLREEGIDRRTHGEHNAIWRALKYHDPDAARIRMANHLLGVEDSLPFLPGPDEDEPPLES